MAVASRIPVTVSATTHVAADVAFDVIAPIDLERIFRGWGPLPAVTGVREQSGRWTRAGESRIVQLSDGGEVAERLTALQPGLHCAYVVGPFPSPLGRLVRDAEGAWWFFAEAGRTTVRWTYAFRARPRCRTLVRLVVAPLWRRYARRVLALALRAAEDGPRRPRRID